MEMMAAASMDDSSIVSSQPLSLRSKCNNLDVGRRYYTGWLDRNRIHQLS